LLSVTVKLTLKAAMRHGIRLDARISYCPAFHPSQINLIRCRVAGYVRARVRAGTVKSDKNRCLDLRVLGGLREDTRLLIQPTCNNLNWNRRFEGEPVIQAISPSDMCSKPQEVAQIQNGHAS
jgi:hypothetical protein